MGFMRWRHRLQMTLPPWIRISFVITQVEGWKRSNDTPAAVTHSCYVVHYHVLLPWNWVSAQSKEAALLNLRVGGPEMANYGDHG